MMTSTPATPMPTRNASQRGLARCDYDRRRLAQREAGDRRAPERQLLGFRDGRLPSSGERSPGKMPIER